MASASERVSLSTRKPRRRRARAAMSSRVLASQMVQLSTEAKASPTITAFTTMSAFMNMPHGDRSRGSCTAIAGAGVAKVAGLEAAGAGVFAGAERPAPWRLAAPQSGPMPAPGAGPSP